MLMNNWLDRLDLSVKAYCLGELLTVFYSRIGLGFLQQSFLLWHVGYVSSP